MRFLFRRYRQNRQINVPLLALVLVGNVPSAHAEDWSQFLGPARNGTSSETGLLKSWPKDGPPRIWEKEIGAGFSGPVVQGSNLILFHRVGNEEIVACLSATDGKERWKNSYPTRYEDQFGFDPGPRSTPLIADGRVYTLGAEGTFHCLALDSGKVIWKRSLNQEYQVRQGFFGVTTSALLDQDLLLVNVGGKDAGVVGLSKENGKEVWRATTDEASYASPVVSTFGGSREAVFFTRAGIVFLNPRSGHVTFSKRFRSRMQASVNAATPLIADDLVFFSACYGTGAILLRASRDKMETVWENDESMSNHYSTCVIHNGQLYGFDGRQESGAHLRSVELMTGKVNWTSQRTGCGSIILAGGNLLTLMESGELLLVQATPERYTELANAAVLSAPVRSPPALAGGKLYARDSKKLVCWNLKN
jgi:outer membrane protein assembly factor BamB